MFVELLRRAGGVRFICVPAGAMEEGSADRCTSSAASMMLGLCGDAG
jgi:hypothetical protein